MAIIDERGVTPEWAAKRLAELERTAPRDKKIADAARAAVKAMESHEGGYQWEDWKRVYHAVIDDRAAR